MTAGQQFSIWAARVSLLLFIGLAWKCSGQKGIRGETTSARALWTLAVVAYLVHFVTAFAAFHNWSHWAAVEHTSNLTFQVIGWRWGGGVYVNYFFTVMCLSETIWWWAAPAGYLSRPRWYWTSLILFVAFMWINAGIIFVSGPQRWVTAAIVAILIIRVVRRVYGVKAKMGCDPEAR